jgi:hypothetical protein
VEAAPAVIRYPSQLAAAAQLMVRSPEAIATPGWTSWGSWQDIVRDRGNRFFLDVYLGNMHESVTARFSLTAVFVHGTSVLILPELGIVHSGMPDCAPMPRHAGVALRVMPGAIGAFRMIRNDVMEPATLPYAATTTRPKGNCSGTMHYRIEDHFVDLASGKHVAMLAQTFDAPIYAPLGVLPGVEFDAYHLTDRGIAAGECNWEWNN